jgi:hypothetical protein
LLNLGLVVSLQTPVNCGGGCSVAVLNSPVIQTQKQALGTSSDFGETGKTCKQSYATKSITGAWDFGGVFQT